MSRAPWTGRQAGLHLDHRRSDARRRQDESVLYGVDYGIGHDCLQWGNASGEKAADGAQKNECNGPQVGTATRELSVLV